MNRRLFADVTERTPRQQRAFVLEQMSISDFLFMYEKGYATQADYYKKFNIDIELVEKELKEERGSMF